MPIVAADTSGPPQIAAWQLAELNAPAAPRSTGCWAAVTQQQCDQIHYQQAQDHAAVVLWSLIGLCLLIVMAYRLRVVSRALRLVDRAAYALGVDSRRIAARWRERA
ncbi:MAG TPA: hypothetical protein VHY36_11110 [Steroidobacteraceae bacterium]|jgi:hypothetical protein|nr:hypothetical protein [Steroidobacteraceae bacterium]